MSFFLSIEPTSTPRGNPEGHQHMAAFDTHGDGNTDIVENHMHIVVNGKVMPAGHDDHTHEDFDYPMKGQNGL